jgi:hypothetical protein
VVIKTIPGVFCLGEFDERAAGAANRTATRQNDAAELVEPNAEIRTGSVIPLAWALFVVPRFGGAARHAVKRPMNLGNASAHVIDPA